MAETLEKDVYAFIDEMATDDWDNGQVMDPNDYNQFARILEESGYESEPRLFNYYFDTVQQLSESWEDEDEYEYEDEI